MKVNDVLEDLDGLDAVGLENGSSAFPPNGQPAQSPSGLAPPVKLPSIPKNSSRSKFSSWNSGQVQVNATVEKNEYQEQRNFMDEVDELLLEQDLLSPQSTTQVLANASAHKNNINTSQGKGKSGKKNRSPGGGQNTDKLEDSTVEKLLNGEEFVEGLGNGSGSLDLRQKKKLEIKKKLGDSLNQIRTGEKDEATPFDDDEEFDLDNSDDLNRFINKYETLLSTKDTSKDRKTPNKEEDDKGSKKKLQGTSPANSKKHKTPLPQSKYNSAAVYARTVAQNTEPEDMNVDDIDNLVDEELSREHASDLSGEGSEQMDNQQDGLYEFKPRVLPDQRQNVSSEATIRSKRKENGVMSVKITTTPNAYSKGGAGTSSKPSSKLASQRSSVDDKMSQDSLGSSQGSQNGKESQMFKELFSTTNKQINKDRGIAGIMANGGISSGGASVDTHEELLQVSNGGITLVSDSKNQQLQLQAQDRLLTKTRSKKDLKNKFQSSAAIYEDANGLIGDEKEDENKENKKVSDLEEEGNPGLPFLSQKGMNHLKRSQMEGDSQSNNKAIEANSDLIENLKESEIDEIIKQHLIEEEKSQGKAKKKSKKKGSKKDKKQGNSGSDNDDIIDEIDGANNQEDSNSGSSTEEEDYDGIKDDTEDKIPPHEVEGKVKLKDEDDDDDDYDYMDDSLNLNMKSPKQTLIEHLRLLADIFNSNIDGASDYYDQIFEERAQFMIDFDNILKIMTFDETVEYILPCMQIYSSELDYLKLKLFQNLEKLFKKLFKAEVFIPKVEIVDIITINIFPLASRMLMLSEEPVQLEGVEALLNLSKTYIPKEQAQNLMQKVIQVIMDRISSVSEHQESEDIKEKAKIAILIIVQRFAEDDIFQREQCQNFLTCHLEDIADGMLFKIKKFLLPALIAISKHLDYDVFVEKVYATFKEFNQDEIWGTRKVCIEKLSSLIKNLKKDEFEKLSECIEFFKRCLNDSNRWVKAQAMVQFGPIVHEIYLKIEKPQEVIEIEQNNNNQKPEEEKQSNSQKSNDEKLRELINKACMIFYDTNLVLGTNKQEGDNILESSLVEKLEECSFMQNKTDDVDKIKYYWAYNLPCAILVNQGQKFWFSHLKQIYELLYQDILINVRTAMSAGFKEIIDLLDIDKMAQETERKFFVDVLNHYLKDSEEISSKVLPTICKLVSKFPEGEKTELLENLLRTKVESIQSLKNVRDSMITMLEQLFDMFQPTQLLELNFHDYLFNIIKEEKGSINYKMRAAKVLGSKIVAPLIKGKKYRALLTNFTDDLRVSKHFRDRQIYIQVACSTFQSENEIFKKHFAKNIAQDFENEKCKCVQILLAKLCNEVQDGYSKSLDKIRQQLLQGQDDTVIQYMP